jgi:hypothetical protein
MRMRWLLFLKKAFAPAALWGKGVCSETKGGLFAQETHVYGTIRRDRNLLEKVE